MKEFISDENFYEIQQFRQIWIWVIILLVLITLVGPILIWAVSILVSFILISTGIGFILLFWVK
ncbi:MAG: hypothetical protein CMG74_08315 [Candidatus Marinimicrobia bacterium]|nr:hypothetical protein [Candidatus Neomarinimicrobiota bacterium]